MKLRKLILELQKHDPNLNVAMSSDEEGNDYYEDIYPEHDSGILVLYPGGARLGLDEIEGYVPEEEDEE